MSAAIVYPAGRADDFDFLVGTWNVINRRLKRRWAGSNDWDQFPATSRCEQRMHGLVNIDEIVMTTKDYSGLTVRTFDVERRRWAIYWINSKDGVMGPPVFGGFKGDRGEFYGDDTDGGKPVKVRFIWSRLGADVARWQQAFSFDGEHWEMNWVMDFTRCAAELSAARTAGARLLRA